MFYQIQPTEHKKFAIYHVDSSMYPMHMHRDFEMICCTEGEMCVEDAKGWRMLKPGEAMLFFPHQPHGYPEIGVGYGFVAIFNPELVNSFYLQMKDCLPEDNQLNFSYDITDLRPDSDLFSIKAFLYSICAAAVRDMHFVPVKPEQNRELLDKILIFVEKHYRENCTLLRVAQYLKYDYNYLSGYFLRSIGMTFNHYVNQRRITYAISVLENDQNMTSGKLAMECGYDSIRSFNRNFKKISGKTPNEYKKAILMRG